MRPLHGATLKHLAPQVGACCEFDFEAWPYQRKCALSINFCLLLTRGAGWVKRYSHHGSEPPSCGRGQSERGVGHTYGPTCVILIANKYLNHRKESDHAQRGEAQHDSSEKGSSPEGQGCPRRPSQDGQRRHGRVGQEGQPSPDEAVAALQGTCGGGGL